MSLDDELRRKLPDLLPKDPADAIYGVDLLEMIRPHLDADYSDNYIRARLSVLAYDPTSPIARLESRFGYYLRPPAQQASQVASEPATEVAVAEASGRDAQHEEKFRAFFMRYSHLDNGFCIKIEHVAAQRQTAGVNKWKFPDVVIVNWDAGEPGEKGFLLDKSLLEVKKSLGEQPFRITSVELKTELSLSTFREHFFQCVSNSKWAHIASLVVAYSPSDSLLTTELRRLGASYGVSVRSFGLDDDFMRSLPPASEIGNMPDHQFSQIASKVNVATLSPEVVRPTLDWEHIRDMKAQSREFVDLFEWIARCLSEARAYTYENFCQIRRLQGGAG